MPKPPGFMRPLMRSNFFYCKTSFLTPERFINYITLRRQFDDVMFSPRVVLLYIGDPDELELQRQPKVKSLMDLTYDKCGSKEKQYIYDHRNTFPVVYRLLERDNYYLKKRLHREFYHIDDIFAMKCIKELSFPKL